MAPPLGWRLRRGVNPHEPPKSQKCSQIGKVDAVGERPEAVDATIKQALEINDRPVVIDFVVERDAMVWPMVPAGVSNDLITMARDITPVWDRDEDDADDVNIPDEDEAVEAAREDGAATADAAQTKEQQR